MTDVYSYQGAETRLVRENGYGILPGSPDWVRMNGFGLMLKPELTKNPFQPKGALIPTTETLDDDFSVGTFEGIVDFNSIIYPNSSMFGNALIASLGGVPAGFRWTWVWDGRRPLRPVSYGCHYGHVDVSDQVLGVILNSLAISGGRADGFEVSGNAFGKAMTSGVATGGITNEVQTLTEVGTITAGNYTITIVEVNETTANILFSANAAAIQAAINALPSIEAGDIVVAGGPIDTTPVTLTYGGPMFAGRNVAQVTVDSAGLTGGTITPTTTTPGADAVIDIPPVPGGAAIANVYLDSTWAGLGSGQLLHAYTMDLQIAERLARVRPINKSQSSDSTIDNAEQEHMLSLTLGTNAVERARLAAARTSTKEFVRVEWVGEEISSGIDYLVQVDACVSWQNPDENEDVDSVLARPWPGRIMIDQVSGNALRIVVQNTRSTLSPIS